MIKSLYDIIWKYWVPTKKKGKSEESLEGEEPAPANVKSKGGQEEDGEMEELEAASDQGEPPCLNDDYVESCLAESLGVPPLAPVVEAVPDSQILRLPLWLKLFRTHRFCQALSWRSFRTHRFSPSLSLSPCPKGIHP